MRRILILALLVSSTTLTAQISAPPRVTVQDEGSTQGAVRTLNCTGSGITCSVSGATAILNATGGSGGGNFLEVSINLGSAGGLVYRITVTGQAWVTATSVILCTPLGTTADGLTIETVEASGVLAIPSNRVVGTGFDLGVYTPHGATGTYRFNCTGS